MSSQKTLISKEDKKRLARYEAASYGERMEQRQAMREVAKPVIQLFKLLYDGTSMYYHEIQLNIVKNNSKSVEDAFERYASLLRREGNAKQQELWEKARKSFKVHVYFNKTWRGEISEEISHDLAKKLFKLGKTPEETIYEYKDLLISYGTVEILVLLFEVSCKHIIG